MYSFLQGQVARVSVEILNIDNVLADPTSLIFKIKKPDGTVVIESVTIKTSVGKYYFDLELAASGTYLFRWESSGNNKGAIEGRVNVSASSF